MSAIDAQLMSQPVRTAGQLADLIAAFAMVINMGIALDREANDVADLPANVL